MHKRDKLKYEKEKEKLAEKYQENKEKISEKYQENKERIICTCGSNIRKSEMNCHIKTLKHINFCIN